MRFVLTTRYGQDVDVFRHGGERFWYALLGLVVLAAPWIVSPYNVGELALVFIWAIAGIGLMLLVGYTGLVSLGHAAFFAIGAYSHAILLGYGVPFVVSVPVAVVLTAGVGALVGIPALRMTGVYLAVATLAFERIVAFTIEHSDPLTGGLRGMAVEQPSFFGVSIVDDQFFYYLCLVVLAFGLLGAKNLLRSPTGRAFVAVRDSEISAESMGVHLARTKTTAFAVSAGFTGLAGTLFAHKARLPGTGRLHRADVDPTPAAGCRGRSRFAARRCLRCHFRRVPAAGHRGGPRCATGRHRADSGVGAWRLRRDPGVVPGFRTARDLRPLAEDPGVVRRVPPIPQGHPQAAEVLSAHGPGALMAGDQLFQGENLSISFGGVKAVRDVSFEIVDGEVFSIIGPNGAGKTTVFNLISRFYDADTGRMTFGGEDMTRVPAHHIAELGIARTFQNTELFDRETVLDNLLVGRHVHRRTSLASDILFLPKVRRQEVAFRRKVEDIIDLLDLQQHREAPVGSLPYGARKMVEIGRALCTEPKLLLLDEPSSGLNPEETEDLSFWIEDIVEDLGITVAMVEHDMNLVATVSNRVLAMADGAVLAVGEPAEIQNHPEVLRAYLGD